MIKEKKAIFLSMIINISVSIMKIVTGFICQSKSILADGIHSLSDFITDIVAYFGLVLSNKRPNKNHPDGYGKIQYLIDIVISTIILLLGISTIINSFTKEPTSTNIIWILVIIFTIILKQINSHYLIKVGKQLHSPILITSAKESRDDAASSVGVIIIILISQLTPLIPILKYADLVGSVIIGILIIKTSLNLYKENLNYLIGETEKNEEIITKIKEIVNKYPDIQYKDMDLEAHGRYYVLELEIYILNNIKVYKLLTIESDIRRKIKKLNLRIRFIDINLFHKSEEN